MSYESITVTGKMLSVPINTARLLIIKHLGRVPKSKRLQKKVLKRAIHKALVLGILNNNGEVSDKIKRKYLK